MVRIAPRAARRCQHLAEGEVLLLARLEPEAVPGRSAIGRDAPVAAGTLQRVEGRAQPPEEFGPRHLAELRLWIVHVIQIDALDPEVVPAALDLIVEKARRERVAAVDDLLGLEHAGLDPG